MAGREPGFRREFLFWRLMGPTVARYWWALRIRRRSDLAPLHAACAPAALRAVLRLRGLYVKAGQVVSARPDIAPAAYRDLFRRLQDDVPAADTAAVRGVVAEELRRPVEALFASFDDEPAGCASIGQAHRATTRDGQEVIVKVQYPDARALFRADLRCLRGLIALFAPPPAAALFAEFERQYLQELDYVHERSSMEEIADGLAGRRWARAVAVPRSVAGLCTGRVLTMTFVPGRKMEDEARDALAAAGVDVGGGSLRDWLQRQHVGDTPPPVPAVGAPVGDVCAWAALLGLSRDHAPALAAHGVDGRALALAAQRPGVLAPVIPQVGDRLKVEAALAPPPVGRPRGLRAAAAAAASVVGVDCALWAARAAEGAARRCAGAACFLAPVLPARAARWAAAVLRRGGPEEVRKWLGTLAAVYGHQLFVTGFFNADPHPGNILVLPDGRLGLIDYGQCKRLPPRARRGLAAVVVALAARRGDAGVAAAMRAVGVRSRGDDGFVADVARLLFGPLTPQMLSARWRAEQRRRGAVESFPPDLLLAARAAGLLRGLGLALRHNLDLPAAWESAAAACVAR